MSDNRTKPTPAPWAIEQGQSCDYSDDGGGGFTICLRDIERCGNDNNPRAIDRIDYAEGVVAGDPEYAEALANARLIAAAGNAATRAEEMGYDGVRVLESLPEILEEHAEWMRFLGHALAKHLQGDSSGIDQIARSVRFDANVHGPVVRSNALAQARKED